jgi:hypothetical protein
VVDALSRRVHEMHVIVIRMCQSNLKDKILEAGKSDPKYMEVKKKLQQGKLHQKVEDYKLEDE